MIGLMLVIASPAILLWLALELDARKHGARERARRRRDRRVADELGGQLLRARLDRRRWRP